MEVKKGICSSFLGVISVKALMYGAIKDSKGPIDIKLVKNDPMDLGSFILTNPNGEKIGSLEEDVNNVLGLVSISGISLHSRERESHEGFVFDKSSSQGEENEDGFNIDDDDIFVEPSSISSLTSQSVEKVSSTPRNEGTSEEKYSKEVKIDHEESLTCDFVEMDEVDGNFTQKLIIPPKEPTCFSIGFQSLINMWTSLWKLSIFMHYGGMKGKISSLELEKYDVVVTTYGTLSAEYRNPNSLKSVLLNVRWLRVVLDEGHLIRNAEAHKKTWTEIIERKIGSKEGILRLQVLLTSICMRRLKNDRLNGKPLVKLPPIKFFERRLYFEGEDAKIHEVLRVKVFNSIEEWMIKANFNRNFGHVLALVMKMRQYCCHPELLSLEFRKKLRKHLTRMGESNDLLLEFGEDLDLETASELNDLCPICLDALSRDTASITQFLLINRLSALCVDQRYNLEKMVIILKDNKETKSVSPKLLAVIDELKIIPPDDKIVLVSQFTSFLSMIHLF
ncbi:SMARCA3 [Lepeophtheirus salmonis]|uniref:SMARCA3 n=1 Tax=Lepeophtheirus salmonis TaxID=72036 RepID=A0A7R8H4H3_LEPSM|nr:SMARCA3 [Lepeophtheirus salmonis]CAF2859634.1 SMARCA3 [Lepeophtheirus salmonis]